MQIDWMTFTPVPSLLGGLILGIAAVLYVLLHGRILGISGIIAGLLHPNLSDFGWRASLIAGLITAPFLAALFFGISPIIEIESDWIAIVIAGLLVGFGPQYGSGCTSGPWHLWTILLIATAIGSNTFIYGRRLYHIM